jgi:hypothetical protein
MPDKRAPTDFWLEPMNRITWLASQNDARRVCSSATVGRLPSRRRSGARSSHWRIALGSMETFACGAGSSTMKTPAPLGTTGRPQRIGPSMGSSRARRRSCPLMGAVGEGVVVTCQPCYARVFLSNAVAERRFRRSPGPCVAQPLSRPGTDRAGDAVPRVPSQTLESPGSGRGFRLCGAAWLSGRAMDPRRQECRAGAAGPFGWCRSGGSDRCCTSRRCRSSAGPGPGSEAGSGCTCRLGSRPSGR